MNRRWWLLGSLAVAGLLVGLALSSILGPSSSPGAGEASAGSADPAQPIPHTAGTTHEAREAKVILARAENARVQGEYRQAKQLYQEALQLNPDPQAAATAQERLGEVNVKLLLSPARPGEGQENLYAVKPADTLSRIAREHRMTVELLKAANGLQGDLIRVGQKLRIPRVSFSAIVDKSQNTMTLKDGEEVFKVYRCSTGAGGITPTGEFRIVSRLKDPAWKGIIPPGDPENPLGSRWLGFDLPEYGLHGTNEPDTIGQPVTKGCVRFINPDVEELFDLLPEGTRVTIVE